MYFYSPFQELKEVARYQRWDGVSTWGAKGGCN
jgi:hypothetical protein